MADCACTVNAFCSENPISSLYFIELTAACNSACKGCGNIYAGDRSTPPLSAQEWYYILGRIAPTSVQLKITGGEPTLHPQFEEVLGHVDTLGIPFTLFTNGRWADPEHLVNLLASLRNLDGLLVSLHGSSPTSHEAFTGMPGSFAEAVRNVERAVEAGLQVTISTVLTRYSCPEVQDIVALGKELDVYGTAFQRYIGAPLPTLDVNRDEMRQAVQIIERTIQNDGGRVRFGAPIPHCFSPNCSMRCGAGDSYATIDPSGNLRPCNHVSLVCGNLLTQPLEEIWTSPQMQRFRDAIPEECRSCQFFEACHGGCRAAIFERGLDRDPLMTPAIIH